MNLKVFLLAGVALVAGIFLGCAGGYFLTIAWAVRNIEANLNAADVDDREAQAILVPGPEEGPPPDLAGGLDASPAPGKRRIALVIADDRASLEFILPGSHIDILHGQFVSDQESQARLVLADARVLAVDSQNSPADQAPSAPFRVTVEVTAQQAQELNRLAETGSFHLALRPFED